MKLLLVSDIHYSETPFHGRDESLNLERFLEAVKANNPDLIVNAGDLGPDVISAEETFQKILEIAPLLTIYGNHDDIDLIKKLRNANGSPCWLADGAVRDFGGLRIAGINGNFAFRKTKPNHRTLEETFEVIETYWNSGRVDLLVTHEVPIHPLLSRNGRMLGNAAINGAIGTLLPKLCLCGHIHINAQIIHMNKTALVNLNGWKYATVDFDDQNFNDPQIREYGEEK